MQQPQRVGAEPAHPGGDRPPGGQRAAMAHGRGDGLLDQLHPSRLGQRLVQGPGTGIGYLPADLFDAQLGDDIRTQITAFWERCFPNR